MAALITELRADRRSAKSTANALGTLQGILRFARRRGWVLTDPVELLEPEERPRHPRRRQRVLGRPEIERLLDACPPRGRLLVTTALYSGLRISELLGLIWEDIDFAAGLIRVRAQLSRAHHDEPARRVAPKTPASVRDVPLVEQLSHRLAAQTGIALRGPWRLGLRHVSRHPIWPPQRGPARAHARRRPGQPHPRPCPDHDHARRLHPPLLRMRATLAKSAGEWQRVSSPPCSTPIPAKPPSRCSPTR